MQYLIWLRFEKFTPEVKVVTKIGARSKKFSSAMQALSYRVRNEKKQWWLD